MGGRTQVVAMLLLGVWAAASPARPASADETFPSAEPGGEQPESGRGGARAGLIDSIGPAPDAGDRFQELSPLRPPAALPGFTPQAVALDGLDRLFILDRAGGVVLRVDPGDAWLSFGVGDQGGARYPQLSSLFARWGPGLFALDPVAGILYQFDLDGHLRGQSSLENGWREAELGLVRPVDFELTKSGDLLLLDQAGGRLLLFDRFGRFLTDLTSGLAGGDRPQSPTQLVQTDAGDVLVLDPPAHKVRRYSQQGTPVGAWSYGAEEPSASGGNARLGLLPGGRVVIAAGNGTWLRVFSEDGRPAESWRNPRGRPDPWSSLAVTPAGILYLACPQAGEVQRLQWVAHPDGGSPRP